MKKTSTRLADGRELIYYDSRDDVVRDAVDRRPLDPVASSSQIRRDPLLGDSVAIASHRQGRTYHPPADECPLCPSEGERLSEIPDSSYDVAVFENRFPSLAGDAGRCEVVCFTSDHTSSFADLTEEQAGLVLEAWTDRTAELSHLDSVEQVFCFENRGAEIGVTLGHPHGQIYGYPFTTPRTALMLRSLAEHKEQTGGRNLFDDVLAEERTGERVVLEGDHWVAFVPYAAHWPYEVHLYPKRRVPDLLALDDDARTEFPQVYLELLRRFDRLFGAGESPTPYIAAWHQAPFGTLDDFPGVQRDDFALHLELFTIRRTSGKLKFLAGSESGMSVFINDVPPETAAERLREVAST
ncbi:MULTISPECIES: galactose-1-phosphate uridylyltransferase [unclassified Streptomyces]|uniref:galactose-1-phosphate uridylyltransferase n=1 Tax=unclassified Streptomyces TaxID=2593676 RepID=UPI00224EFD7B|nr:MULTISPECIES: galactose-1-phosphate uridylyltransferase [unclassified Streptomyces]MCX5437859.1 galactose-1-phosphate uridylyltransferase [Streptomyces sp. NBC_00063]WSE15529.1 galactose-1-phosphate uridylyltransferase [Streptomyces sp. NBC_01397]WUB95560.1 galactose-1-phosphate uridylyltransferase [Streptomyces sp. NBC_00569]